MLSWKGSMWALQLTDLLFLFNFFPSNLLQGIQNKINNHDMIERCRNEAPSTSELVHISLWFSHLVESLPTTTSWILFPILPASGLKISTQKSQDTLQSNNLLKILFADPNLFHLRDTSQNSKMCLIRSCLQNKFITLQYKYWQQHWENSGFKKCLENMCRFKSVCI